MKPLDFVNLRYKPKESDLICLFRVEPNKISMKKAAATVALESSIGTWSELTTEKDYMKKLFSGAEKPRLKIIGDISCDVDGGVECLVKVTEPGNPMYIYNPLNGEVNDGVEGDGVVMMAVDILPSELPLDASTYFSSVLKTLLPGLVKADLKTDFENCNLPPELKKAVIVYQGELTSDYQYLKKYL